MHLWSIYPHYAFDFCGVDTSDFDIDGFVLSDTVEDAIRLWASHIADLTEHVALFELDGVINGHPNPEDQRRCLLVRDLSFDLNQATERFVAWEDLAPTYVLIQEI